MNTITRQSTSLLLLACGLFAAPARAQSTAFTYQGKLKNAGQSASGVHDFRFRLFDALTAGSQVGAAQCIDNLAVDQGLFTATLDFGAQFTTPAQRYLEIDVRLDTGLDCGSAAAFQTLAPRQLITAAPLATQAKSAFSLAAADGSPATAVFVDNNGNVGIGTQTPQAKLQVDSGDMHVGLPASGWFFHTRSSFSGDFMHITDTVAGAPQFQRGLILNKTGRVGVGTSAPQAALDVRGDVKLGNTGQLFAPGGEENLRIIRGVVSASGSIIAGSGFAVTHTAGTATYTITFTNPFPSAPTITAITDYNGSASAFVVTLGVTGSTAVLQIRNLDASGHDNAFHLIAVGPR